MNTKDVVFYGIMLLAAAAAIHVTWEVHQLYTTGNDLCLQFRPIVEEVKTCLEEKGEYVHYCKQPFPANGTHNYTYFP